MKNQSFLGGFLVFIGMIGLLVGLISGHFMESPAQTVLYVLPVILGGIMIVLDHTGTKR